MKKLINKRSWECGWCHIEFKKKDFIKSKWIYFCNRCWYCNSDSIFKEYKEVEVPKLVFWIDTKETLKEKLKPKKKHKLFK